MSQLCERVCHGRNICMLSLCVSVFAKWTFKVTAKVAGVLLAKGMISWYFHWKALVFNATKGSLDIVNILKPCIELKYYSFVDILAYLWYWGSFQGEGEGERCIRVCIVSIPPIWVHKSISMGNLVLSLISPLS